MSERKKTTFWPWIVAVLIGLPVLYVLSFGPACWLDRHGKLPDTDDHFIMLVIYAPLMWGADSSKEVKHVLEWYAGLWVGT